MTLSPAISEAARWLVVGDVDGKRAVIAQLRERFGLSAPDAVAAIREANLIRARAE
jgi:hypothetical protein